MLGEQRAELVLERVVVGVRDGRLAAVVGVAQGEELLGERLDAGAGVRAHAREARRAGRRTAARSATLPRPCAGPSCSPPPSSCSAPRRPRPTSASRCCRASRPSPSQRPGTTVQDAVAGAARRPDGGRARAGDHHARARRRAAARRQRGRRDGDGRPRRALRARQPGRAAAGADRAARAHRDARPGRPLGAAADRGRHAARAVPGLRDEVPAHRAGRRGGRRAAAAQAAREARAPTRRRRRAALQQRLADLGFLPASGVDGVAGEQTRFAVLGFQKWARIGRDGDRRPGHAARRSPARPRPTPRTSGQRAARRGAARPPARALHRGRARRADAARLHGRARLRDAGRPLHRVPQGAALVVRALQGVAAVGELLRRRRRLPRVRPTCPRGPPRTAACACRATTRAGSTTGSRTAPP